jgi:hypothetical protein
MRMRMHWKAESMRAKAEQSIAKELRSMADKGVFEPVSWGDLLVAQRKRVIRSSIFEGEAAARTHVESEVCG